MVNLLLLIPFFGSQFMFLCSYRNSSGNKKSSHFVSFYLIHRRCLTRKRWNNGLQTIYFWHLYLYSIILCSHRILPLSKSPSWIRDVIQNTKGTRKNLKILSATQTNLKLSHVEAIHMKLNTDCYFTEDYMI